MIIWNDIRKKYWTRLLIFIKYFGNDLLKMPPVWRNYSHAWLWCHFVSFFHFIFKSESFCLFNELWCLVLSRDFQEDSSQVTGWSSQAALFSFSKARWELPWLWLWNHCPAEMSTLVSCSSFLVDVAEIEIKTKNNLRVFKKHQKSKYLSVFTPDTDWTVRDQPIWKKTDLMLHVTLTERKNCFSL